MDYFPSCCSHGRERISLPALDTEEGGAVPQLWKQRREGLYPSSGFHESPTPAVSRSQVGIPCSLGAGRAPLRVPRITATALPLIRSSVMHATFGEMSALSQAHLDFKVKKFSSVWARACTKLLKVCISLPHLFIMLH